jgi:carboxypeptidase family protein
MTIRNPLELLLAALAAAILAESGQPPARNGRLSGVVVEEGTNLPVSGATVAYVQVDEPLSPSGQPPEVRTDDDGRFAFDNVGPGRYRVGAHKEGFAPQLDESALPVVELDSGQTLTNINVVLEHGGAIAGRVLDPTGGPLFGTRVVALLTRLETLGPSTDLPPANGVPMLLPFGTAETNTRGEFRIEQLPAGDYLVAVGTTFYPGTTSESAAQPIAVRSKQTVADIAITIAAVRTFRVSGIVTSADEAPVPNVYVHLMPDLRTDSWFVRLTTGPYESTQSDSDGNFTFNAVAKGTYTVSVGEGGGIGALSATFSIDATGTPVGVTNGETLPLPPDTVAVTVNDADVTDVKIVARKKH